MFALLCTMIVLFCVIIALFLHFSCGILCYFCIILRLLFGYFWGNILVILAFYLGYFRGKKYWGLIIFPGWKCLGEIFLGGSNVFWGMNFFWVAKLLEGWVYIFEAQHFFRGQYFWGFQIRGGGGFLLDFLTDFQRVFCLYFWTDLQMDFQMNCSLDFGMHFRSDFERISKNISDWIGPPPPRWASH